MQNEKQRHFERKGFFLPVVFGAVFFVFFQFDIRKKLLIQPVYIGPSIL
jgi:hypothetical protein